MTGRARGRARGRGRGGGGEQAARPGQTRDEAPPQDAPVGRGRSRGTPAPKAAAVPPQQQQVAPPTQQMAKMTVREEQPRGRMRGAFEEPKTKPPGVTETRGSAGDTLPLLCNYFKLNKTPAFQGLFQYNVSYNPQIESRGLRRGLLNEHKELLGSVRAFDGMVLFLPHRLPEKSTKVVSTKKSDESRVELTITLTADFPIESPQTLQVMNLIFRRQLKILKMQQIGRHYFSPDRNIDLRNHNLQLWPGYATAIAQFDGGTLLCADVSHKVMRLNSVLDLLYELYNSVDPRNFHNLAVKKLVGEIVITRYNNKTYRIDDIDWEKNPRHTFPKSDGTEISFKAYYEQTYDKVVSDDQQPLIVSNPKKRDRRRGQEGPILLLPEFCFITGLSEEIRSNFNIMKELAVHTRMGPEPRATELLNFMKHMKGNAECSQQLSEWNLEFDKSLLGVTGRALPVEKIYQREKTFGYDRNTADWSRDMRGNSLISTVNLDCWMLLFTNRDSNIAQDFFQTLVKVCGPMGINVTKPGLFGLQDDRAETYLRTIRNEIKDNVQMVVCIVPNNRKERYDAIKKLCCVERPVPSQCIVSRTLSKKQMLMSVATKIGIQLNCKLGGEVWGLEIPVKKMMVVGVDVYHDSATKGKSIGGFVASTNQHLTRYYSRITQQHTGLEFVDGLKTCMIAALKRYNEINNCLPDRIIVYRDGVGDGQLAMVHEHELPQVLGAINSVAPGYNPKFAWIVVKKNINTKFFLNQRGSLVNPPPGTVVDTEVTRKEWYDFFLVSQSVRQGTVNPTHYNVISDTSGLKPDHIQRLTYKLTHLYYNWPGTIRVPAPCQYAHKLAFLVGQSIHQEPDHELADRLFYL